jgi:hypothetical protein
VPWCCTFHMTRWLRKDDRLRSGNMTPPGELSLGRLAVLAPTYALLPNLQGAQQLTPDPTWLAYSVYALPNARLAWDGSRD